MSLEITRKHFNVEDYYRMTQAGILSESDRVELLDGEVVEMSPIGSRHAATVDRLNKLINKLVGDEIVRVQSPICLDEYSEPQPDVCLLKPRSDFYSGSHPTPEDVLLVIGVADSSVELDRVVKLPLYAQAGVPEVWIVNLPQDIIEIYSQPVNDHYTQTQSVGRGERLSSPTVATVAFDAADILS